MVDEARLELLAAMSVFLAPPRTPDPARVMNLVLCLSLFDEPSRLGTLADLRRRSKATNLRELRDYIGTCGVSDVEAIGLVVDVRQRIATVEADIARIWQLSAYGQEWSAG